MRDRIRSRVPFNQVTPYEGVPLFGRVKATFVRGQLVFAEGGGGASAGKGAAAAAGEGRVAPRACGAPVLR